MALDLQPTDNVLVITSAGCNVLDYALTAPHRVDAVDANPRQNALLELKLAEIRELSFDDFFAVFGAGQHPQFDQIYHEVLRERLTPFTRDYWDHATTGSCGRTRAIPFTITASPESWRAPFAPSWR